MQKVWETAEELGLKGSEWVVCKAEAAQRAVGEHRGWQARDQVARQVQVLFIDHKTFNNCRKFKEKVNVWLPMHCCNHRVGRVLSFFSSRRNWDPPPPHPRASVAPPPLVPGGGEARLRERGWESPNSDEETYTAVLFIYMYFVAATVPSSIHRLIRGRLLVRMKYFSCPRVGILENKRCRPRQIFFPSPWK